MKLLREVAECLLFYLCLAVYKLTKDRNSAEETIGLSVATVRGFLIALITSIELKCHMFALRLHKRCISVAVESNVLK